MKVKKALRIRKLLIIILIIVKQENLSKTGNQWSSVTFTQWNDIRKKPEENYLITLKNWRSSIKYKTPVTK